MTELAAVIPMFNRTGKLQNLLGSISDTDIPRVYIADNGKMTDEKKSIYKTDYCFDLSVFNLEYDSGIGNCRHTLASQTEEKFLITLDSDMEMPNNYRILVDQLESKPSFGGIGGIILDKNKGRIRSNAGDLEIKDDVVRKINTDPSDFEMIEGSPLAEFEFIQNAAVFRRSCLDDYSWDDSYIMGRAHVDFFLGHKKNTDWRFGISPQVIFPHYPGGSNDYNRHRKSESKQARSQQYFRSKWDVKGFQSSPNWIDTVQYYKSKNNSKIKMFKQICEEEGVYTAIIKGHSYTFKKIENKIRMLF